MGLRHIIKPTETVTLADGQSFSVSGITPNHAIGLYHRHRGQLAALFDAVVGAGGEVDINDVSRFAADLFGAAPLVMAEIITLAAGGNPFDESPIDPDVPDGVTAWQAELATAAGLPFPVQLDALEKIGGLTFTPEMPPKKFLSVLVNLMQGANGSISQSSLPG